MLRTRRPGLGGLLEVDGIAIGLGFFIDPFGRLSDQALGAFGRPLHRHSGAVTGADDQFQSAGRSPKAAAEQGFPAQPAGEGAISFGERQATRLDLYGDGLAPVVAETGCGAG